MADKLLEHSAHASGRTCLAFSRDGIYTYTGGCDSLVRVWRTDSGTDQEPDTALDSENSITSLATDNDGWISGSEDCHVRRYMKSSTELESLITRIPAIPVRCVACDPKGRRVAVTSDELDVKIIDLDDTTNMKVLKGHTRGVRSATWHPTGSILTTCGCDGKIIVWNLENPEPKVEKIIEGIIPVVKDTESAEFDFDCSAVWHNSGQYFIVANQAHEIITISRSNWSRTSAFANDDALGSITAIALSVNGVYLASACQSGVFVWSTMTRRVISRLQTPSDTVIHQLAFSPSQNLLAWTDSRGSFTRWPDVIPPSAPSPVKAVSSKAGPSIPVRRQASPLLFAEEDDTAGAGDKYDGDIELDDQDDDWIVDDLGGGMEDKPSRDNALEGLREMVSVTKAQPLFHPGSTPFKNKRRYLSFNSIGVVEVVDQDTHHIVNVEFHDQTTRKNHHFTDHFKFDLASLGERGVVYACPPENDHPAQITYKPYATWASQGEWTYQLPKGERAVAIAAGGTIPSKSLRTLVEADVEGNGYVAVATDKGYVRFFSGGGLQRGPIWAVDGDIVSMVAGRDYVFLVHREGGASLDGNQNLKYTLRTSDSFRVLHTGRLPVNKGQTLKWIGISDEGAPVIYDSLERVMMLEHFRFTAQGSWVVLLDTKTLARRVGKDESYWPIGVSNSTLMCIILKGKEIYPGFPRPLQQEIEMQMPYLDMDSPESQKEERVARETILLDHIRDTLDDDILTTNDLARTEVDLDKEIIMLIQLACKHDKLQRAIDAAKLLHHTASFDMAAKVADFYHLPGLREKITVLKSTREQFDRNRDGREQRRDWRRANGPLPPLRDEYVNQGQSSSRPFQSATPAPSVHRPRLAAATPSSEPSPFARKAVDATAAVQQQRSPAQREITPPEKRKRDQREDVDDYNVTSDANAKRRAMDDAVETRTTKPNPFAKKVIANNGVKANPFLKKPLGPTKSVHKSDSFFDKVNTAESEVEAGKKTKGKQGKMGKQTTLFGLPSVPVEKKSKSKKTTDNNDSAQEKEKGGDDSQVKDTQESTQAETVVEESQEETQFQVDSQQETQLDTQVTSNEADADDEMAIEWPESPPPMAENVDDTA